MSIFAKTGGNKVLVRAILPVLDRWAGQLKLYVHKQDQYLGTGISTHIGKG